MKHCPSLDFRSLSPWGGTGLDSVSTSESPLGDTDGKQQVARKRWIQIEAAAIFMPYEESRFYDFASILSCPSAHSAHLHVPEVRDDSGHHVQHHIRTGATSVYDAEQKATPPNLAVVIFSRTHFLILSPINSLIPPLSFCRF